MEKGKILPKNSCMLDCGCTFNGTLRAEPKFIVIEYDIPKRSVATYFPEANTLVPIDSVGHTSNTPTSKSVIIKIEKTAEHVQR